MFDRDKISKDIESLKQKHESWRAVEKLTEINKTSLQNYFDKITEPREENVRKLATAMRRMNVSYYYKGVGQPASAPATVPSPVGSIDRYIESLEARIVEMSHRLNEQQGRLEGQTLRINDLSATLQSAIDERKTDINRIDKRHNSTVKRVDDRIHELDHQLGTVQSALIEFEKTRDLKHLKILSGSG